jgi:hypothetical protein
LATSGYTLSPSNEGRRLSNSSPSPTTSQGSTPVKKTYGVPQGIGGIGSLAAQLKKTGIVNDNKSSEDDDPNEPKGRM